MLYNFKPLNDHICKKIIRGIFRKNTAFQTIREFSFFLGIPVMLGASVLKIAKFGFHFAGAEFFYLILGMAVAFIVSVYSIRFLLGWIRKNDFKPFGYYRIVFGVIVLIWYGISSLVA